MQQRLIVTVLDISSTPAGVLAISHAADCLPSCTSALVLTNGHAMFSNVPLPAELLPDPAQLCKTAGAAPNAKSLDYPGDSHTPHQNQPAQYFSVVVEPGHAIVQPTRVE